MKRMVQILGISFVIVSFTTGNAMHENDLWRVNKETTECDAANKDYHKDLHGAALHGCISCVKLLIANKADVNEKESGSTPLHKTTVFNRIGCAQELLKHGAALDIRNMDGETPLHKAALNGWADLAHEFLLHGAVVDARDDGGRTALRVAAPLHQYDCMRTLIFHGADLDVKDNRGFRVSDIAITEKCDNAVADARKARNAIAVMRAERTNVIGQALDQSVGVKDLIKLIVSYDEIECNPIKELAAREQAIKELASTLKEACGADHEVEKLVTLIASYDDLA